MRSSKSILALAMTATIAMVACDDDPAGPNVEAPTITFAQAAHASPFFMTGTTAAPTIDWGGETGTLALASAVTGVSLDTSTGVVSWDESLAIGVNAVEVVATNSAGSDMFGLEIDNEFQGQFDGGANNDPESETPTFEVAMTFADDGTLIVVEDGTDEGEGTWTRDGTTITAVFSFDEGTTFITFEGDVTHDTTDAVLEGFWFDGEEAVEGEEAGFLTVSYVPPVA